MLQLASCASLGLKARTFCVYTILRVTHTLNCQPIFRRSNSVRAVSFPSNVPCIPLMQRQLTKHGIDVPRPRQPPFIDMRKPPLRSGQPLLYALSKVWSHLPQPHQIPYFQAPAAACDIKTARQMSISYAAYVWYRIQILFSAFHADECIYAACSGYIISCMWIA